MSNTTKQGGITNISIEAMHVNKSISMSCVDMSIDQKLTPNWSEEYSYGKMDPISSFSHTSRTVTVNFVLVGTNIAECMRMQSDIDQLMKFQYPKYGGSDAGVILTAPPFFKINVLRGKLYNSMEGYFTDISITPGSTDGVVPLISRYGNFAERKYTVSFTMVVLHAYIVGYIGIMGPTSVEPGAAAGFIFTSTEQTTRDAVARGQAALGAAKDAVGAAAGTAMTSIRAMGASMGADGDTPLSDTLDNASPLPVDQTSGERPAAGTSTAQNAASRASE